MHVSLSIPVESYLFSKQIIHVDDAKSEEDVQAEEVTRINREKYND